MQILVSDRTDYGHLFTWLSTHSLDWLQRHLLWRPAKTGYLELNERAIRRMTLKEAVTVRQWVEGNRKNEAEQIRAAYERGAGKKS
jgi:hypothetical protein